jgi:MipA family protein
MHSRSQFRRLAVALATATLALPTMAASEPKPLWELGFFGLGVAQQAYPGAKEEVRRAIIAPYALYRGKVLRVDQHGAGLRAINTPTVEVELSASATLGAAPGSIEARRGMPELGTLVEVGPRIRWNLGEGIAGERWRLSAPVRGVFDLSNGMAYRGLAFEPELALEQRTRDAWTFDVRLGALVGNRGLVNTFYEVAPQYATLERPAYEAKPGLISWRLGVTASRRMGPDWRLLTFVRVDNVAGAANASSPLIKAKTGASAGIGLAWTWMRSSEPAEE